MDGAHRAYRAILLNMKTVKVSQFENSPDPSQVDVIQVSKTFLQMFKIKLEELK